MFVFFNLLLENHRTASFPPDSIMVSFVCISFSKRPKMQALVQAIILALLACKQEIIWLISLYKTPSHWSTFIGYIISIFS